MTSRQKIFLKRGIAVLMFGVVLVQVLPSLADVLNPGSDPVSTVTPSAEPTSASSPEPEPTTSQVATASPAPEPSGSYMYVSGSESATPEPTIAADQDIVLRVPSKLPVDPRATSVKVAPVSVYSTGDVLVCISTTGSHFWLSNQSDELLIKGNNSKFLLISGPAAAVTTVLNSGQGLRVAGAPKAQGTTIFTRAAVVTQATVNSDLCAEAPTSVSTAVTALGIAMDTVKNPVRIK